MTIKVPTVCNVDGCPQRATHGSRCDRHEIKPWGSRSPSSRALASSPAHRRERKRAVRRTGNACEGCGYRPDADDRPLELHHPEPIGQGGAVVQPKARLLCPSCHLEADREAGARR